MRAVAARDVAGGTAAAAAKPPGFAATTSDDPAIARERPDIAVRIIMDGIARLRDKG